METRILKLNEESIDYAAKIIHEGKPVAFPTETVYGLGINAFLNDEIKEIYRIKGRPSDNPLIVHFGDVMDISLAAEVTPLAKKLIDAFMPGPITVVLKKKPQISDFVTAGLDSVGVRVPMHEGARKFLKKCGVPIAAPSANTSTRPSPTSAKRVFDDLNGKIELILDGGQCEVGIESTVVDATGKIPEILRPGKITAEDIKRVVGDCISKGAGKEIRSPGLKYKHYSPNCRTVLYLGEKIEKIEKLVLRLEEEEDITKDKVAIIAKDEIIDKSDFANVVELGSTLENEMMNFYEALLKAEKNSKAIIIVLSSEKGNEGILNRAKKAAGNEIYYD